MKHPKKLSLIKTVLEVTTYSKKKINQKKFTIKHINKDESITLYGVGRSGKRFKTVITKVKNESEIEKIFNNAKKEKDARKNNVTLKMKQYTGKLIKKSGKISGGKVQGVYYYNIDKKQRRLDKNGKIISYTSNYTELIKQIILISDEYKTELIKTKKKRRVKKWN